MWSTVAVLCITCIFGGVFAALDMTVGASVGAEPQLTDRMVSVIDFIFAYGPWTAGISLVLAIAFSLLSRIEKFALSAIRVLAFTVLVNASAALIAAVLFDGNPGLSHGMTAVLHLVLHYGPWTVFVSGITTSAFAVADSHRKRLLAKPI